MAEPDRIRASRLAGRRYWLIGASEGLGRALAEALDRQGVGLVLSARSSERLQDLADRLGEADVVAMDVTDPASVEAAAKAAGEIDGLIYSVGLYQPVTATNWNAAVVEAMVDANFTGALRVLGRTLPGFCARRRGHVVLVGSLAGFRGLPGAIGYGASKAALMHLGENLRADLVGSGVSVQLVNPGFISTRLTAKNAFAMPQIMTPEVAAAQILRVMEGGRFQTSFPAPFAWLFTLGRLLPLGWFQRLFRR